MKPIVVIPAYNEQEHIAEVVRSAKQYVPQIIVVDDASKDDTKIKAVNAGALTIDHIVNLGKAGAIKTGCDAAVCLGADIIILMDGDGQHDPSRIPTFLDILKDDTVEIVFGSRTDLREMPFVRRAGTKLLEYSMRYLFQMSICDMQCGYRAFRTRVYPLLRWDSKNYHADAEITARTGKYHLPYKEIPIKTIYHDSYKGMTIIDGLMLLGKIVIWKFTL
ncbi:hypothetical protein A3H10_03430 [Candidatus Uhrbacteria bacterium RIFCSPLOWO2_12_FULL_46_10]|uniref:Glycosyltransferase 2-like domain-containing protein n=1 Tax=Candidatus Uhrbacteria bacterium RIFCSPLOWO2_01_FULL_47_25 TaxID=1802402 RepID=A0A1F7UPV0_9BACT|nr:MAG: Glycosyl transferase family 2 [Parcubacteria group bacterium GW2011_GWA2_46_9]OGL61004.1 MAG: hypothetical protein A2752_00730 [Candidatus Uhrbacteria bacterium RIFCSPHIGHO2_01_FULL_46_23]OGL69216.1 MAG: hypothetical protein A3D60_04935 [Candidatus Uhrbacteria bacterium RIFCSPHIGHO2_02_FULL_47_29]OGL80279.1 MAG: hypothetical protein A2936_02840 [Candidatus Uhrbacteria bacterium RIFCSPLOWO2_01_FULL_47_25]OGL85354.1 MAG: hypothetical protein A3I37_00745 [Candidatus Uhrbacteria bacterium R